MGDPLSKHLLIICEQNWNNSIVPDYAGGGPGGYSYLHDRQVHYGSVNRQR